VGGYRICDGVDLRLNFADLRDVKAFCVYERFSNEKLEREHTCGCDPRLIFCMSRKRTTRQSSQLKNNHTSKRKGCRIHQGHHYYVPSLRRLTNYACSACLSSGVTHVISVARNPQVLINAPLDHVAAAAQPDVDATVYEALCILAAVDCICKQC